MAQLHGCMRATFAEEGMSVGQMILLRVLIHKGDSTPKELAEALSVTTGNITGLLDKLEAAGLVTRTRSAEDRRVVHVELTAKARQRFRKVHRASVDMLSEAFEGWTRPEITQLQNLLERLSSNQRRDVAPPRHRAPLRH
jgi:DNA-binding MarR family transcriptional regulator